MPPPALSAAVTRAASVWAEFGGKIVRYTTGSVIAAACSETVFVLVYGGFGASTTWATGLGWLAGAVPNFWLNRSWTWRVSGRPDVRTEILPYILIIVFTLVTATVATSAADAWLRGFDLPHTVTVILVSATFLGVYGMMFLLRFFLLDRLFRTRSGLVAPDERDEYLSAS